MLSCGVAPNLLTCLETGSSKRIPPSPTRAIMYGLPSLTVFTIGFSSSANGIFKSERSSRATPIACLPSINPFFSFTRQIIARSKFKCVATPSNIVLSILSRSIVLVIALLILSRVFSSFIFWVITTFFSSSSSFDLLRRPDISSCFF